MKTPGRGKSLAHTFFGHSLPTFELEGGKRDCGMSANNVCVKEASWVQIYPTSVEVEVYMNFCFFEDQVNFGHR